MTSHGAQQEHTFTWGGRPARIRYLLYLPKDYDVDQARRWPLVLFLHGAGERGDDLRMVAQHGIARVVEERDDLPFIAVSPQCPPEERWDPTLLGALLDEIERDYRVDLTRIYVTGLSMGGAGTWALAIASPDRFAAIVPICGRGDPSRVSVIKHLPVWVFHGAKDDVVPLQRSEEMVEALRACGGNVRFTVYPDAWHDSWTETYANPELYTWLLSHTRTPH